MGNPATVQRLKEINRRNIPDIIFLTETKNPDEKTLKDLQWLTLDNYHTVPPETPRSGVLFLYWKKEIELTVTSSTKSFIDTSISYKGNSFHATFVYGEPEQTRRQEVWNALSTLHTDNTTPWFLTGDFNEIIDNSEKCGGPDRAEGSFGAFRTFLSSHDLFDLKHCGSFLSWRGQRHTHLVQCRLDRAICNTEWSDLYPSCRSQYLRYGGSDHRPLISFLDATKKRGNGIFRFDRRLKENQEVKAIVKDLWERNSHLQVEAKLSLCRQAICKWSKAFQENSRKKLDSLQQELDKAMSHSVANEVLIRDLNAQILKTYLEEENFWKQRSRQLWLSLGDANTGYFHASAKTRKSKNRMTVLEDEDGLPNYEEEKISEVICSYYSKLFTSIPFNGEHIVHDALVPCITEEENEMLTAQPTCKEIQEATFAIHPDKAPGPDGFSAAFFQSNWDVTGPAIIQEIQQFFATGSLPAKINHTYVRLIPKHGEAKRAEDYRPIALCNIYYKIISKLLSLRLQKVLNSLILENQSAFIPGRSITDNVLITHEVPQYLKTSKATKHCYMAVKTDMSKAYDRIECSFVRQVLNRLGFHNKWV